MKVIDSFLFFKDLDLLEIRLNSLAPYVSQFALVESPLTFTNKPKPLYFDENKDRFKDFDIIHSIFEPKDMKKHMSLSPWNRGYEQLRYQMECLKDIDPETMLLLSDGDEIPNLKYWNGEEGAFMMERYYYMLNGYAKASNWFGTDAVLKKNLPSPKDVARDVRLHHPSPTKRLLNGGWHFCCLGSIEEILHKYENNAHQEICTEENFAQIRENVKNHVHPLHNIPKGRHIRNRKHAIKMPVELDWLMANKDRYKHLFYGE